MKLNHDCVRDVLLSIESKPYNFFGLISQFDFGDYSYEEIIYSIEKLIEAGFLNGSECSNNGKSDYLIKSITYEGHAFLDNIRPQEVWDQTKSIVSKVGSASLDIFSTVAAEVILKILTK